MKAFPAAHTAPNSLGVLADAGASSVGPAPFSRGPSHTLSSLWPSSLRLWALLDLTFPLYTAFYDRMWRGKSFQFGGDFERTRGHMLWACVPGHAGAVGGLRGCV